ncbi:HtaA domain-containing protein [Streptomyces sp. ADMS]|uniref:HtaA domain-containing protein n=1 Tax=Streptomyces sp. ADMS TaxID=3071415 RepID=UPI00296F7D32|nr:HtaA domain-containing protein [Streptomyces sp. ADMS]MDW4909374.1 HtaA domain-containing protein [Streptomyces sp. ADMS]
MSATTRRPLALAAAVATAVALGATALATTAASNASAAEIPLSGYELTWGIKQSYRAYVTGMAAGTFTPADGATQAADNGAFTFTEGTGAYDSTSHTLALGFKGSLKIASTLHGFELALSDVRFDSRTAKITADVTKSGTTQDDVPLADVTVTREMTDMATRLTPEAATVLGSAGYSGAAGDPLTVVEKKTASPSPSASPSTSASATPSTSASPSPSASASTSASPSPSQSTSESASPSASPSGTSTAAPVSGDITDGTLGWGVKQSFRTYVVDGVAKGAITTSDGATQAAGNGVFTFADGSGTYDTDAETLSAAFAGAVNFKGHEDNGTYGLDLTLSDLRATIDNGTGELTADVESLGETSDGVVLADLTTDAADLTAVNDVITLSDVTAKLTAAGAKAFGDFYETGAELDPVDLSVAVAEGAELPGGDGGSDSTGGSSGSSGSTGGSSGTTGSTGSTTGGTGLTTDGVTGGLASTGAGVPVGALGTAAAVTVAAGAGVVLAVRRRRTDA